MRNSGSAREESFLSRNWLSLFLMTIMFVLVIVMSMLLMAPNQTAKELALTTFILTAASVVASVLITKIYAEDASNKSLRDHGVQIASGIMVLKRQIAALTEWVDTKSVELAETGRDPRAVDVLEHIEQTLTGFRDMTDAALGGIGGVIGDALAQYESVMEQISHTRADADIKTIEIQREIENTSSGPELAKLHAQVADIASSTEKKIAQLSRSSALPIPVLFSRKTVTAQCPRCATDNSVEILDRPGETRGRTCQKCGVLFNVHVSSGGNLIIRGTGHGHARIPQVRSAEVASRQALGDIYIEPRALQRLIQVAVATDREMKRLGKQRTPRELQNAVIAGPELLTSGEISNGTARTFFYRVFKSRAFSFPGVISFDSEYVNDPTEDGFLAAYATTYVWVLASRTTLRVEDLPRLAADLFDAVFSKAEVFMRQALNRLPPDIHGIPEHTSTVTPIVPPAPLEAPEVSGNPSDSLAENGAA